MSTTKKIGILTSGGDCAGLNAVIRAVVNSASRLGWEVYGIKNGTDGRRQNSWFGRDCRCRRRRQHEHCQQLLQKCRR